ncbi:hypothetical protein H3N56_04095 [Cetobacterium sp. 2A]|uniref:hypothetical protein n=1 Tax=Cetobacterium sp. 2A TaxID=2754723 RepID=UPI00163C1B50|nr:hypothetical protein [Cetobacterium sp. 2A]MBC2855679.1 hypothetical protein [Cetobacterium sp. 2A]
MKCKYNQYTLTCFFGNIGYRPGNCPFGYLKKNNFNTFYSVNYYKKYFNDKEYNAFTGILEPNLKRVEYINIYNVLRTVIEINRQLKNIFKIYNKILKGYDIIEDLKEILIHKTLDQVGEEIKESLKRDEKYQRLSEGDKIITLISIDAVIGITKDKHLES